jgi:hypothetical protein
MPPLLTLAHKEMQWAEQEKKGLAMVSEMNVSPTSFPLFLAYLRGGLVRAKRHSPKGKSDLTLAHVKKWMGDVLNDAYNVDLAVCKSLQVVSKHCGWEGVAKLLKLRLFNGKSRFFPIFVGVLKFRKGIEDTSKLDPELRQIGINFKCRAHGSALQLIENQSRIRLALDLAQFYEDCVETELLLRKGMGEEIELTQETEPVFEPLSGRIPESIPIVRLPPATIESPPDGDAPAFLNVGLYDFEPIARESEKSSAPPS